MTDLLHPAALRAAADRLFPGIAVAGLVAVCAQFLSEHYGAPAMLMAILLGIALHFLSEEGRCVEGIDVSAKKILRIGVALLGVRISLELLAGLGPAFVALTVLGVAATIGVALLVSPLFGRGRRFAFLTGGSVAICGASAAMAISAVLPRNDRSEQDLVFTVVGVTVLSTAAMIVYPIVAAQAGLDPVVTGVFLGGTIHDVAQVVGAGYSVSEETGDVATLVKLIRVSLLAPVVLIAAMVLRAQGATGAQRPPLLPGFVVGFLVLAALNSMHLIPAALIDAANAVSRWALLTAIAAVGMKTSIPNLLKVGRTAILMLVAETLFLATLVLGGAALLA
ncbi:YeiH family protein [Roseivivax isoporae]|uniref:Membrane protein n=1 Tax=Roseivivax isoporae LMG 25204 TaxID=1449351 RepID=X7F9B1_9RHOB|nr:YeiH family protein [Roseivivax isoporae]ETX28691.1 membrane protein [Roseivivax isoporae LMG 25204]